MEFSPFFLKADILFHWLFVVDHNTTRQNCICIFYNTQKLYCTVYILLIDREFQRGKTLYNRVQSTVQLFIIIMTFETRDLSKVCCIIVVQILITTVLQY